MSLAGIRITGSITVTDRITRQTAVSISTGTTDGSYTITQTDANDLPWFNVVAPILIGDQKSLPPTVTLNGWVLSWTWAATSGGGVVKVPAIINVGVY